MADDLVSWIFRRFAGIYGNRFTRMWDGLDVEDIKAQWAEDLSRLPPESIRHALFHLPESMPPTLLEFKALCNRAPIAAVPALSGPKPDPRRVAQALADARKAIDTDYTGPRGWAYRLCDREQAGERLSLIQKRFWREALHHDMVA